MIDDEGRTLDALLLSLRVAGAATALAAPPGVLLGLWLARTRSRAAVLVDTAAQLPLVLPATAVGYALLVLLSRRGPLAFDPGVLFTWRAAVLASAVMSLPLVVQAARVAFEAVDPRLERMAASLGYRRGAVFARVTLPLARRGLLAALVLGFTRAFGEFGATVVVAGNVRGETQTIPLAIFEDISLGREDRALVLFAVSAAIAFAAVLGVGWLRRAR